jgi:acetoacetyl-CoA synthetase
MTTTEHEVLWAPPADAWDTSRLGRFAARYAPEHVGDHEALWRWSVDDLDRFWLAVWEFFDLSGDGSPQVALADTSMPGEPGQWFPGIRVNYAEHALRGNGLADDDVAVIGESQSRDPVVWTVGELRDKVARCAAGLKRLGVEPGDRVAGYLPNVPEALVAFLASASIGAIWSSCAPEFGTRSVVDRWSQIEPTVLLVVDGYRYGDKPISRAEEVGEIRAALPSVQHTVVLGYLDADATLPDTLGWSELCAPTDQPLTFEPVGFDHPLYVLYSSGTTGLPKPIVHRHGGILVEHVKVLGLHHDLGPDDRFFWFSTTGWMMWNFLVSGLLVGCPVVLFDGNPGHPDLDCLWEMAARNQVTVFGVSAPFLMACRKEGLTPGTDHDLQIRQVGSTGAPLPPAGFRWVYDAVSSDLQLASVSGGTDVCSGFVGASPMTPVKAGVIACRLLGCDVQAFDESGSPVVGQTGELVIRRPMPSMPVGFWGDDDGSRYRAAYFEDFPGVWRHGDWITIHDDGSCVITGRSDATLNRGGVRLGTSEFYAVVESIDGVADSLVVHLEDDEGGMGELLLFIAPVDGREVDDDLVASVRTALRTDLSPRHVPDQVVPVRAVPRTLSGKKLEVPVKKILTGADPTDAAAKGALANPDSLDAYIAYATTRHG